MVEDLKKDISEWRRLGQSDLAPLIKKELDRLFEQMKQTYAEMQREVKAVYLELNPLETE